VRSPQVKTSPVMPRSSPGRSFRRRGRSRSVRSRLPSHVRAEVSVSPSSSMMRLVPSGRINGSFPSLVISTRQARASSAAPETVPVAMRSPVSSGAPPEAWCATICASVQNSSDTLVRTIVCGPPPVSSSAMSSMSRPPASRSNGSSR
jgi:hypothetical protein